MTREAAKSMGRTEPTVVRPPAAFRRDARAKRARATINKVIPALLSAHPRARAGIERSELIVDPPPLAPGRREAEQTGVDDGDDDDDKGGKNGRRGGRRRRKSDNRGAAAERRRSGDAEGARDDEGPDERAGGERTDAGPRIAVRVADTLTAARALLDAGPSPSLSAAATRRTGAALPRRVGILNMASPLSPGGGFLSGAGSQEESLCMRTTLLPALRDEFYRLPELGVVYTPDVLVFRDANNDDDDGEVLPKGERWFVDVVSAAMLRLPETEDDGEDEDEEEEGGEHAGRQQQRQRRRYSSAADRELAARKMRAVMRVFAARGCARVVLGAWGCGAYGNPVAEIAAGWRRVLRPEAAGGRRGGDKGGRRRRGRGRGETWGEVVEEVVFAIKDAGLAASFARAFGEDLLAAAPFSSDGGGGGGGCGSRPSSSTSSGGGGGGGGDPARTAHVSELRDRMAQLETQVGQARGPHLRDGLEAVLAGLRKQLPPEYGDELRPGGSEKDDGNDEDDEGKEDCSQQGSRGIAIN